MCSSWFVVASIVCVGYVFVWVYDVCFCVFHLAEEEEAGCFTLIVLSCVCLNLFTSVQWVGLLFHFLFIFTLLCK